MVNNCANAKCPGTLFWKEGSVSVYEFLRGHRDFCTPVMLVPSLVNRSSIFRFGANLGFIGYLLNRGGLAVYLVDFDDPIDSDSSLFLEDYVRRICFLLEKIAAVHKCKVAVLGYCMGGVMSVAVHSASYVGSLTLISTPWSFDCGIYLGLRRKCAEFFVKIISDLKIVPAALITSSFSFLQLRRVLIKYDKIQNMNAVQKDLFWEIEDWLHNGINMTQAVAKEILNSWIIDNLLAQNKWVVGGRVVDPQTVHVPAMLVIAKNDTITPLQSSLSLWCRIPYSYTVFSDKGHLDFFVKQNPYLWNLVYDWILKKTLV